MEVPTVFMSETASILMSGILILYLRINSNEGKPLTVTPHNGGIFSSSNPTLKLENDTWSLSVPSSHLHNKEHHT